MISIEFHGAASTVTGSNYLVKTDRGNFIVDCGMFQGPDVELRNLEPYEYDATEVDFSILTHAHIDHSGMLPKLYKSGFRGPIFATHHTIQIASDLLLDSAKIQENNFRRGDFYGHFSNVVAMVYDSGDATQVIESFKPVHFMDEVEAMPGIKLRFIRAGHVLGAASVEVTIESEEGTKKIMFSGDIGREKQELIPAYDMEYKSDPDYILIESLYGGKTHPDRNKDIEEMMRIIRETVEGGGNVMIPCFSVQRTQEIIHDLKVAKEKGMIDKDTPVWLDSPLAQRVTRIYREALQSTEKSLFSFPGLTHIKHYKESVALTKKTGQVIIAGSGMAEGGRIMGHLLSGLGNPKNTVMFVGFQAEATTGRALTEGAQKIDIGKTRVPVKAKIVHFKSFSAHGDTNDYIRWMGNYKSDKLKKVFLIHSDEDRAKAMIGVYGKMGIDSDKCHIPKWKEVVELK